MAATGVKDVCRAAGLTDRYFYEAFKDSQALFLAVFDAATERLFVAVAEAVMAAREDGGSALRAAVATFLDILAGDPRLTRVVFTEAAAAGPEANQHMLASLRRFTDLVEATAAPHVRPGTDSRMLALALVGTLERAVIDWQDGALDRTVDQLTDEIVRLFTPLASGS